MISFLAGLGVLFIICLAFIFLDVFLSTRVDEQLFNDTYDKE